MEITRYKLPFPHVKKQIRFGDYCHYTVSCFIWTTRKLFELCLESLICGFLTGWYSPLFWWFLWSLLTMNLHTLSSEGIVCILIFRPEEFPVDGDRIELIVVLEYIDLPPRNLDSVLWFLRLFRHLDFRQQQHLMNSLLKFIVKRPEST